MTVVEAFDEGLDAATLLSHLLVVLSVDWFWVSINACHNSMPVALFGVSVIVVLNWDNFKIVSNDTIKRNTKDILR